MKARNHTRSVHKRSQQWSPMGEFTDSTLALHRSIDSSTTISSLEMATESRELRRVKDDIPKKLCAVAAIGLWERATFWGTTTPWQNYMQHPRAESKNDTPGALGLGQAQATRIYCAFYMAYYITPLFFAVLSDNYLGRYRTLFLSLSLYAVGCIVLTVSSIPSLTSRGWDMPGFIVALICIALGGGGFQSNISAFLADQYPETAPKTKTLKSGEEVITDRGITLEYIYNLYFWVGNVGSLSAFATVALEKNAGFTWAFLLTSSFIIVALVLLLLGRNWYEQRPLEGNIIPKAASVLACASRNGFKMSKADPIYQLEKRHKTVPWTSQLVIELTRALGACRVLLAFVMFYLCFDQMQNNFVSQSSQMETNGTPNDMVGAMNQVGCIIFVPLSQHVLNPLLHRRKIYLRPTTRIAIGFMFICTAMLYAAIIQHAIYTTGPCFNHPNTETCGPNRINVWVQGPQYVLIAIGEIFAFVTAIEWAYKNAPEDMKAIVQAVNLLIAGMGSALAMSLTPLAHDPNMTIFYGSLAGAMTVTTLVFWCLFRKVEDGLTFSNDVEMKDRCNDASLISNPEIVQNKHETKDPELGDAIQTTPAQERTRPVQAPGDL